jgi:hypothetical protein
VKVTSVRSGGPITFDYRLLSCADFEHLLNADGSELPIDQLASMAFDYGRVLLQARGGAGKTTTLRALASKATAEGLRVAWLDVLAWAEQSHIGDQVGTRPEWLLAAAEPSLATKDLADGKPWLLLIDGLNEIAGNYAGPLLTAVDRLASTCPSLGVVVSDRLHRRTLSPRAWALTTLTPVPESQILDLLPGVNAPAELASLTNPYYLQLALDGRLGSRSGQHYDFLVTHGGVVESELPDLAEAAYQQYAAHGDRRVDLDKLSRRAGSGLVSRLTEAGIIVPEPTARFFHHLVHDFLAATYVATRPDLWNSSGFDVLTFKTTSMDALAMVLEQTPDNADLLVRRVYDWNLYAAAYLLAEDRQGGCEVSAEMELAVLTMLGERRFDRFSATAQQASDALRLVDSEVASHILNASSREAILEVVRDRSGQGSTAGWFADWLALYGRSDSDLATFHDLEVLKEADSLLGWTTSNVLRRSVIEDPVARALQDLATTAETGVVRWRSVHALGAMPSRATFDVLLAALDDDDAIWVRYGAIRSLIEIALADPELRREVFESLSTRVHLLRREPQLLREIERVLVLDDAPASWPEDTAALIVELWAKSDSVEEQDRWRHLGDTLRHVAAVNA